MRTIGSAVALAASTCIATVAQAQPITFDIPASSLKDALDSYARQSRRPVIYKGG